MCVACCICEVLQLAWSHAAYVLSHLNPLLVVTAWQGGGGGPREIPAEAARCQVSDRVFACICNLHVNLIILGWLGSRVVSVLDSGAVGPGFKLQPRRCRVTFLGKLFTPIMPLFTKQRNW